MVLSSIIFLIITLALPRSALAQEANQFITLVNPVRISSYSTNPAQSLINQYSQISANELPASWLLTFDVLENPEIIKVVKSMDDSQDIGIFLEVSEKFSDLARVKYNKTDSWHRASSVLLTGYTQEDRIKLIDTVFGKFKQQLGYYPTSVGSWWTDSFSLKYMQQKYGITANLVVADQLFTDGYTIWGQYWAMPYYPSLNHAAIPAQNPDGKINVVNIQWAPRDPINGYIPPPGKASASLYSTQDYYTLPEPVSYFEDLINLYADAHGNKFGQITFGLEGDFPPDTYNQVGQYSVYIKTAKKFANSGFQVANMQEFSRWYMDKFPDVSPAHIIYSKDLLESNRSILWYQSPNYRIAVLHDRDKNLLQIIDLRSYAANFQEPFYQSTNKQIDLFIKLPSVIDGAGNASDIWEIENVGPVKFETDKTSAVLSFQDKKIELTENEVIFENFKSLPKKILRSPFTKTATDQSVTKIRPTDNYPITESGYLFRDLTLEATFFIRQKKTLASATLAIFLTGIICLLLKTSRTKKTAILTTIFAVYSAFAYNWYLENSTTYYVSQAEIDGLLKLKALPPGKVLVSNHTCLQCSWNTNFRPAGPANKRRYVAKISKKQVVRDGKFIEIVSKGSPSVSKIPREYSKTYLRNLGIKYVYLVKHEDYSEKLPFSPGDSSATQVFINSDVEIWEIK